MNYAKLIFLIGVFIVESLTAVTGIVSGAVCLRPHTLGEGSLYTVQCSRGKTGVSVQVICRSDHWANFPSFKVNSASVAKTQFINCSFAQNLSILDTFHLMNINYSKNIEFENLRTSPTRQNLQNLSVSQLVLTESNLVELPFDMLYDVLGIKNLIITTTNLARIPNHFFQNWSRDLRSVDLMGNKLQKIARDDFAHLDGILDLILYGNEIAEVEAGAFDSLSSLVTLELGNNRLLTLPSGVFHHLTRLEVINLGQNPFDKLSSDLLTSIQDCHLRKFRMNFIDSSLKALPNGFFQNLAFLSDVELTSNQLESLPTDLFAETSELVNLNLRNNSLTSLPSGLFNSFKKLKNLDLAINDIATLPAGIFEELVYLDYLDISYNDLTTLESDVVQGLGALTKFDASHNNLIKVDDALCDYLASVEVIDLSFNHLTFEAQTVQGMSIFNNCKELRNITLSHNKATKILDDFASKNWEYIDLSFNNFSQLTTEDIENMMVFKMVNLQNNQISNINLTGLPSAVARYKAYGNDLSSRTVKIVLGNNPLHCDCHLIDFVRYWNSEHISEFRQYVKLTATDNGDIEGRLTCASPAEFQNHDLHNVRPEDLNCVLKTDSVDDACTNTCTCREYPAKQVLSVDCSYRNLMQLPAMISNVHNWSLELNISHNMLKHTPSLRRSYLANVTSLDLSSNNISTVTIDVFSKNLVDLKLHNNSISRLDQTLIKYLANSDTLRVVTLHQNPWLCDCETHSFLNFVQKKTSIYRLDGITCYGTNKKLYKMTVSDVCKDAITFIVCASLLVALFGIVLGVLAALYYKYQREIKVWLYSKQCCLWFVTEDELDKDKKYDAFVSFSHKDEDFVEKEIVAKLEDAPRPYKLCLHYRDWLAGEWIPVQISQSVEESRRTIVVLSPNFLESVWGRMEFRAAHTQALKEGRARVIIILYGEIENMDDLDPELKAYLSLNTYVKWGDPWFWDKLRYALPHRLEPSKRRTRNGRLIENHLSRHPVNHDNANANAKSDVISMSKLANDSDKLLDRGVEERKLASAC